MSKIRINELARELEVKPNVIIDLLPVLGVADKKTHSSSLEDDVVLALRQRITGSGGDEPAPAREAEAPAPAAPEADTPRRPAPASITEQPAHVEPQRPQPAARVEAPAEASKETVEESAPARLAPPLRPPLATGSPAAPLTPPISRGASIPVKPAPPAPKPGQILSGPRQPMPPGVSEVQRPAAVVATPAPATPRPGVAQPSAVPSIPTPRMTPSRPAGPGAPALPPPQQPTGGGGPLRPPAKPNLAGQPVARPVVPPRPDLVAKLAQRPAMPTQPGAPRPGMPTRPASPVPGQPIYRGPVRPGQPLMRGPGGPGGPSNFTGPGGPPMRGRARPMHPTSPLRAEPATLPTDPGRRHATKPGSRSGPLHRREQDTEGRMLRPVMRRDQPVEPPPIDREITIAEGITVKELSEKLGVKANLVIKKLVEKKIFATINQTLDVKLAEELSRDFGASTNKVSYEEESTHEIQQSEVDEDRERRPPVVTIMGHVDHGKTSLLDAIRSANVAAKEAGGITQHIGAYHVEKNGRKIVFIDTPGHEAFTRMRARGAKVTDIVVLVVAADDGVMPQTVEAIDHAKAAGVPLIVAINKIDKADAQIDRIKQQLADRDLLAEDWGGSVVMVPVSAKAKTNLDLLLEMILLVADLQDLKANPARPAMGTVLEAQLDRGRGPVATVLVRNGTLRVGDYFICGSVFGRVRAMFDDRREQIREVLPSMPAEVIGLESMPEVGDTLQVVTDTAKAKQIVIYRESKVRELAMSKTNRITLDQFHAKLGEGEVKDLNIILKTDVGGTAEVLTDTLQKLSTDKVKIRVLRSDVGAITESDVLLAAASSAIIVGFSVRPDRAAQATAEQEKVDIRLHTIIYELVDEIKKAMTGMLDPVFKEVYKGRALVREVFRISKVGTVAGCMVDEGSIPRSAEVRLLRDNRVVFTGKIDSLKRFKNDASEVKSGFECGISLVNYNDIKQGDVIEAFVTERVAHEALV
ncbi:MAG TPA: translation initiation factor IF-2 [Bryobacteraceae bacterium]|jgi:translation initiation factor IF-2|nr:translation initiation factor IF-2 [Bryobacteraceae bacterium]